MRRRLLNIETLRNPGRYSQPQLDLALRVAYVLSRGTLVLLLEPETRSERQFRGT